MFCFFYLLSSVDDEDVFKLPSDLNILV